MKVSILTPTYNRAKYLEKVYNSLVINTNCGVDFEWLIMDDGSTDNTEVVVQNYISQGIVNIKYYKQHNMGKMTAINNLMNYVTGDICLTCDSDDYFTASAFKIIESIQLDTKTTKTNTQAVHLLINPLRCNLFPAIMYFFIALPT